MTPPHVDLPDSMVRIIETEMKSLRGKRDTMAEDLNSAEYVIFCESEMLSADARAQSVSKG